MTKQVSRKRREKKAPATPGPHVRDYCPLCGEMGEVIGGNWCVAEKGGYRLARWACRACAGKLRSFVDMGDGTVNAAEGVKLWKP